MRGTIIIPTTKPGLIALNSPRPDMKDLNTGITKVMQRNQTQFVGIPAKISNTV